MQQQCQLGPWDNLALHSYSEGGTMHMSFCCSNNRISVVGARSLGLGLRVNQTLRILVVSANLMGEAPADLPVPVHTDPSPVTCPYPSSSREYRFQSPDRGGGLLDSSFTTSAPCHSLTHLWPGPCTSSDSSLLHRSLPVASPHLPAVLSPSQPTRVLLY